MPINCRKGHRSNILILNAVLALKMYSKDLNKKFKFKNPQLSFLSLNIYILLYSKKRKKIYDLNIFENLWEKNPSTFVGYFLENDFWTPPPRPLSILYTDLKCKTCGRSAQPPSLSWSQHSAQKVS